MSPLRTVVLTLALTAWAAVVQTQRPTETQCPPQDPSPDEPCSGLCPRMCAAGLTCCVYGRCARCVQPVACPQPGEVGDCMERCGDGCGEDICCSNGCGNLCTPPLQCPPIIDTLGTCAMECGAPGQSPCVNGTLCCPTGCGGRACQTPV